MSGLLSTAPAFGRGDLDDEPVSEDTNTIEFAPSPEFDRLLNPVPAPEPQEEDPFAGVLVDILAVDLDAPLPPVEPLTYCDLVEALIQATGALEAIAQMDSNSAEVYGAPALATYALDTIDNTLTA